MNVRLATILGDLSKQVTMPGYRWEYEEFGKGARLRASYDEPDSTMRDGPMEIQHTRWWIISVHATKSEIAQTMFKCVLTSAEHRVREWFKYKGKPIYGPHYDLDILYEACEYKDEREDLR